MANALTALRRILMRTGSTAWICRTLRIIVTQQQLGKLYLLIIALQKVIKLSKSNRLHRADGVVEPQHALHRQEILPPLTPFNTTPPPLPVCMTLCSACRQSAAMRIASGQLQMLPIRSIDGNCPERTSQLRRHGFGRSLFMKL